MKLRNGFPVSELIKKIELDFVFSTDLSSNNYLLLNVAEFGTFSESDVISLLHNNKVAVIDNDKMELKAFNVDETELIMAMMEI